MISQGPMTSGSKQNLVVLFPSPSEKARPMKATGNKRACGSSTLQESSLRQALAFCSSRMFQLFSLILKSRGPRFTRGHVEPVLSLWPFSGRVAVRYESTSLLVNQREIEIRMMFLEDCNRAMAMGKKFSVHGQEKFREEHTGK